MQAMAELGFVVVQIDGMGTSNRSQGHFHGGSVEMNIADAVGFPDRIRRAQGRGGKNIRGTT